MAEVIFKTTQLTKEYKKNIVLNGFEMQIQRGDIYGFIGENGAGKTTLIRILTGLAMQTGGEISLFGETKQEKINKQRNRIGCIIEAPALYLDMTARQNLEVQRLQRGIPGEKCIDEVLELVNLLDTGSKKAKHFSLGMKQRLGLAIALLGEPEFLVLDEPINGLDPSGIVELRSLLKKLNTQRQITILISSHILGELHQLATRYGIIHKGKMLQEISAKALDEQCKKHIHIKVDNPAKAVTIIEEKLKTSKYQIYPDQSIKLYDYLEDIGHVSRELAMNNLIIEHIGFQGDDLESYFMKVIGGDSRNV